MILQTLDDDFANLKDKLRMAIDKLSMLFNKLWIKALDLGTVSSNDAMAALGDGVSSLCYGMDLNRLGMKALGCGTVSSDDAMASFDDGM